jgi:hypothetical protein
MGARVCAAPGKELNMRVLRQVVAVILLGLALSTSGALAAEVTQGRRATLPDVEAAPNFLGHLWDLLTNLWSAIGPETITKEGCDIDPWGRCIAPPGSSSEEGCAIDPAGADSGETGCEIDPWGKP